MNETLALLSKRECDREKAEALAAHLGVPLLSEEPAPDRYPLLLILDGEGLSLSDGELSMRGDFSRLLPRIRPQNLSGELPVRAAKIKDAAGRPLLIDATAGLGEDSFLLAAAGFDVILYEYDPVIAALLRDALERAKENGLASVVSHMELREENSIEAMKHLTVRPDVVFLDPMFPERKKSGLVKKKFQLIHGLETPCDVEAEMLASAIAAAPKKIVIKRPAKGPFLAGVKPSSSLCGKAIRYDLVIPPRPEKSQS